MIGIFDSGLGGLTILRAIQPAFANLDIVYLGDHANVPYGNRPSDEIIEFTRAGVEALFRHGAKLVILGCNTATAVAARHLQRQWLPGSQWQGHSLLGIVAPTVEAATQTPWAVTTPQYPQKFNTERIAVFATTRTVDSGVYVEEIRKRCPQVEVYQQRCPGLASAIERGASPTHLQGLVHEAVVQLSAQCTVDSIDRAILGCTHFPLAEAVFRKALPVHVRLLSQPQVVANSLQDYLGRHPALLETSSPAKPARRTVRLFTTGDPDRASAQARIFWPDAPTFQALQA
ncbi:MAG: aspartate/glutamate racemase family protein [Pseudomonadota bacterium]